MLSLLAHSFVSRNNIRKHVITSPAQFRNHKNKNMSSLPTQFSVMRNIIEKNMLSPIRTALISDTTFLKKTYRYYLRTVLLMRGLLLHKEPLQHCVSAAGAWDSTEHNYSLKKNIQGLWTRFNVLKLMNIQYNVYIS